MDVSFASGRTDETDPVPREIGLYFGEFLRRRL
jgi:hypothetical protein